MRFLQVTLVKIMGIRMSEENLRRINTFHDKLKFKQFKYSKGTLISYPVRFDVK